MSAVVVAALFLSLGGLAAHGGPDQINTKTLTLGAVCIENLIRIARQPGSRNGNVPGCVEIRSAGVLSF